jgi:hypothetical protein
MNFEAESFNILIGIPHKEVVSIFKRQGIIQEKGSDRVGNIRQYIFTQTGTGREYLVSFAIGGDRPLVEVMVNMP